MVTYFVTWEIEIDANTPREAAEKALAVQRDSSSFALVFGVFDKEGEKTAVDLLEEEGADRTTAQ